MEKTSWEANQANTTDFMWSRLPAAYFKLKPRLYKIANRFHCLTGPNPQAGIYGSGNTAEEAVYDWNDHLQDLLLYPRKVG